MMALPFTALNRALKPFGNLLAGRPVLATFQVNLRCNSACGYCDLPLNVGRYEMTREEIRSVFSCLYREGVRFVLVQGGEPLLRRDVPEILEDLSAIGFQLTLITNGTKVTPQLVERLGRLPLAISVSVDTLDRVRYQKIRPAHARTSDGRRADRRGNVRLSRTRLSLTDRSDGTDIERSV
jgi:molybdenum cofactor biosynthesis enzyme MoaA